MSPLIFALPKNESSAYRLASLLAASIGIMKTRQFPDGETYIRFVDDPNDRDVILVCTLDRPDSKILPLILAAEAARDLGARRVGLVAPYLCYMRQDARFQAGEAITSRTFAKLLSRSFDWLVTVEPHLHRYKSLDEIYSIPARTLSAAPAIANWINENVRRPYLIGPDTESRQWVEAVAAECGASWTVARKTREGDRAVHDEPLLARIPDEVTPVLLDDIISTGATLLETIRVMSCLGREPPIAITVHGLCDVDGQASLAAAGTRLITTNSVPNFAAQIDIMPLIAEGVAGLLRGNEAD